MSDKTSEQPTPKITVLLSNKRGTDSRAIVVDAVPGMEIQGVQMEEVPGKNALANGLEMIKLTSRLYNFDVVKQLEGKILTLVDLAITDKEQREAFKGLVRKELYDMERSGREYLKHLNESTCRDGGSFDKIEGYIQG